MRTNSVLETHVGAYFDYLNPDATQVCIEDIAHALSQTCRFGGHTDVFYSVAEHSSLVTLLLKRALAGVAARKSVQLAALLHDAHEAYVGDLPTPLKRTIGPGYYEIRDRADEAIAARFGLRAAEFHTPDIRWADATALRIEAHFLKPSGGTDPAWDGAWEEFNLARAPLHLLPCGYVLGKSPEYAKRAFLAEFEHLYGRVRADR